MIPNATIDLTTLETTSQPTLTYYWDEAANRIRGKIDGQEAILQAVKKILFTIRYAHTIYSGNYGHELDLLIGKEYDYVVAAIEQITKEALLADDRIISVTNFKANQLTVDSLEISFEVETTEGFLTITSEVAI